MKAIVVYESHWGNTAAVARAIAAGLGPEAQALTTDKATPEVVADADLVVAGSPVIAFRLPTDRMLSGLAAEGTRGAPPPDLSHPSMRTWLAGLPKGRGRSAGFETGVRWSPGGATGAIAQGLAHAGFAPIGKGKRFVVTGRYGPLKDGELDRATAWGKELATSLDTAVPA